MKDSFMQYYNENKPKYGYKIKLAVDDVSEEMVDKLIRCLEKYDIEIAEEFYRTPIQNNPLDFPNVKHSPVFISDIVLNYPSTDAFLQNKIAQSLGLSDQRVVVYTENDPREHETQIYLDRIEELSDGSYIPVMGQEFSESENTESKDYQEHKSEFLKELEAHRVQRDMEIQDPPSDDYHSYLETAEESSPGLFGRMKPKG